MGGFSRFRATAWAPLRASARLLSAAVAIAAIVLVALPASAIADSSVPPPACPPDVTLQGVERAPGGVILVGHVTAVAPGIGRVRLGVDTWYHRGPVAGLERGEHPDAVDLALGPGMIAAGTVAPTRMPRVGSRLVVVGTWLRSYQGIRVGCGVLADMASPTGEAWLERVEARYVGVAPTATGDGPSIPVDDPWVSVAILALGLCLAAGFLSAVADTLDPLPAT